MKILVAEDNPVSGKVMAAMLEKMGYEPILAEDGQDAFAFYESLGLRVIVSDWDMPLWNGLDLCKQIRSHPGAGYPYFILLTGVHTSQKEYEEAMAAGVDDFLAKPIDPVALQMRLSVAKRIEKFQHQVVSLEKLLPLCMYCKKIRDQHNSWHSIESFLTKRVTKSLSHGICPDCYPQARRTYGLKD
ncbi:MAG: response regulator [Blastocatellia bacterium]|nr:response regulator [Blastocatellia bacterium]